jgi:hypothetical protein
MRQAILIERADLDALRRGLPMTLNLDGHELVLVFRESLEPKARGAPRRRHRMRTEAERRAVIEKYLTLPKGAGKRMAYLKQAGVSTGLLYNWRLRYPDLKDTAPKKARAR